MLKGSIGVKSKGVGVGFTVDTFSCAPRFCRRRRRKNPKTSSRARHPIKPPTTPPTIEPAEDGGNEDVDVGSEDVVAVPITIEPAEDGGNEDVDAGSEDVVVVPDDDVPFWIMR